MFIHCKAESDHFQFELEQIANTGVVPGAVPTIAVAMVQIILNGNGYGGMMGAVGTNDYLVAEIPLHQNTHVHSTAMSNDADRYAILSTGFEATNLAEVKVALVVCHKDQWLSRMQALETKYNLPHFNIQGIWDKQHPDVKSSYLFLDMTLENHLEIINYAKIGGFKHVMPYRWIWSDNIGSYSISQENYGGLLSNLKTVADNLHAEDLKLGLHVMAYMVSKRDRLLKTGSNDRLVKETTSLILAEGIDSVTTTIPITKLIDPEDPGQYDKFTNALANGEKDILIDNEIMTIDSIDSNGDLIVLPRGTWSL